MLLEPHVRWQIAACYRATYLGLAVLSGCEVLEVRRHRVLDKGHRRAHLEELLRQLAHDYAIHHIVVEPGSVLHAAACSTKLGVQTLSLDWAKQRLMPLGPGTSLPELCEHLLRQYPRLHRLISAVSTTGRVDVSERSATATILAVALGLAAGTTPAPHPPIIGILNHINYSTLCHT